MASKTALFVTALLVMAAVINAAPISKAGSVPGPHDKATEGVASTIGIKQSDAPAPVRKGLFSLGDTGKGMGGTISITTTKIPYPTAYQPTFAAGEYGFSGK